MLIVAKITMSVETAVKRMKKPVVKTTGLPLPDGRQENQLL
jgi:hypothetical protein